MASTWQRPSNDWMTRYARSIWRLPVLIVAATLVVVVPLYWLRGMRLVRLAAAATVGLAVAALGFERPFQTLALALFLAFSGSGQYLPLGSVVAGLLAIAVARVLFDILEGGKLDLGTFGFRLALAVLLAAALTSMLVARNWTTAAHQAQLIALGLVAYVAITHLASTPQRLNAILLATGAGMCVATLVVVRGLVAARGPDLLRLLSEGRFGGIHGDPNVQATIANCLLPPMLHAVGRARGWRRAPIVFILLSLIATVVLSQSRAGMAILAVLLLALTLRSRKSRPYAFAGLAVFGLIAALLPPLYWVRFGSIGQFAGIVVDRSLQLRAHVLEGGWDLFLNNPWLGVGLGNFGEHSPHFMLGHWLAHNSFLEVAATIGVFGLVAYVALIGSGVGMAAVAARTWEARGMRGDRGLAESIAVAIVVFALGALTLSIPFYFILWVLLGFANAARRAAALAPGSLSA